MLECKCIHTKDECVSRIPSSGAAQHFMKGAQCLQPADYGLNSCMLLERAYLWKRGFELVFNIFLCPFIFEMHGVVVIASSVEVHTDFHGRSRTRMLSADE